MEICVHRPVTSDSQTQHEDTELKRCQDNTTTLLRGFKARKPRVFQRTVGESEQIVLTPQISAPRVTSAEVKRIQEKRREKDRVHIDICEDLEEFQPQYSLMCKGSMKPLPFKKPWTPMGKSCLVTQKMRWSRNRHRPHLSPLVMKMMKLKTESDNGEVLKITPIRAKRKWCAAPFSRVESKLKGRFTRQAAKRNKNVNPLQRGKWILRATEEKLTCAWKKLCSVICQGKLAHCNCKLEGSEEIWVYCDVCQADQVGDVLREELSSELSMKFQVQGHSTVKKR
ncbi:uncharacterized protein [Ptychodera flava]|uniref:uncharacterized protein n=1 Tax=Ptychodera flava TaxID=63121 RepID=UPI00396A3314